jgi:hypothetical protein
VFRHLRSSDRSDRLTTTMAIVFVVGVVGFVAFHLYLSNDTYRTAILQFGSPTVPHDPSAIAYVSEFDVTLKAALLAKLLNDPAFTTLKPIADTTDPQAWLANHVVVRPVGRDRLEVVAKAASGRVRSEELTKVVDKVVSAIHDDATEAGVSVDVISRLEIGT